MGQRKVNLNKFAPIKFIYFLKLWEPRTRISIYIILLFNYLKKRTELSQNNILVHINIYIYKKKINIIGQNWWLYQKQSLLLW